MFPAKVWLYIDEDILDAERLEAAPLIAELVKRIAAAGIGTRIFLRVRHKFTHRLYLGVAAVDEMDLKANDSPLGEVPAVQLGLGVVHTTLLGQDAAQDLESWTAGTSPRGLSSTS